MLETGKERLKSKDTLDIELKINNFGPVREGEIRLKPLTVLIGPNNSGKSYVATLIHAISDLVTDERRIINEKIEINSVEKNSTTRLSNAILKEEKKRQQYKLSKNLTKRVYKESLKELFQVGLSEEIERLFICSLTDLSRISSDGFSLSIRYGKNNISLVNKNAKLRIRSSDAEPLGIEIVHVTSPYHSVEVGVGKSQVKFTLSRPEQPKKDNAESWVPGNIIQSAYTLAIRTYQIGSAFSFKPNFASVFFLPAARSGMMQAQKVITSEIFSMAPLVLSREVTLPNYSGEVHKFMSSLSSLPMKKGPLASLSDEFQKEMINGRIVQRQIGKYKKSEILYEDSNGNIFPLNRVSSTICELAPLFLYIEYYVNKNTLLIIEEPEAHLDSRNQVILARLLARLIRNDVHIVITTHSSFLLDQLSNLIMASGLSTDERLNVIKTDDYIKLDEMASYRFVEDRENGTVIQPIEISRDEGITHDDGLAVYDYVFNQSQEIQRILNKKG